VIAFCLKSLTICLPTLTVVNFMELAKRLQPVVLSKKTEEQMLLNRVPEKLLVRSRSCWKGKKMEGLTGS
jgi:hypothetical protein